MVVLFVYREKITQLSYQDQASHNKTKNKLDFNQSLKSISADEHKEGFKINQVFSNKVNQFIRGIDCDSSSLQD